MQHAIAPTEAHGYLNDHAVAEIFWVASMKANSTTEVLGSMEEVGNLEVEERDSLMEAAFAAESASRMFDSMWGVNRISRTISVTRLATIKLPRRLGWANLRGLKEGKSKQAIWTVIYQLARKAKKLARTYRSKVDYFSEQVVWRQNPTA